MSTTIPLSAIADHPTCELLKRAILFIGLGMFTALVEGMALGAGVAQPASQRSAATAIAPGRYPKNMLDPDLQDLDRIILLLELILMPF